MKKVRFEQSGSVGHVILASPPLNRLDLQFIAALRDVLREASERDSRLLLLWAERPNFAVSRDPREWAEKSNNRFQTFTAENSPQMVH